MFNVHYESQTIQKKKFIRIFSWLSCTFYAIQSAFQLNIDVTPNYIEWKWFSILMRNWISLENSLPNKKKTHTQTWMREKIRLANTWNDSQNRRKKNALHYMCPGGLHNQMSFLYHFFCSFLRWIHLNQI